MARLWLVAVLVLAIGCTGKVRRLVDAETDGPGDATTEVSSPAADGLPGEASPSDQGTCSPDGVKASCDPIANTGCSAGACYVTKNGFACVCPVGTATSGGACGTTVECAPTNVCAGSRAPGVCRTICDPSARAPCPGGEFCLGITGMTGVGYCTPHD